MEMDINKSELDEKLRDIDMEMHRLNDQKIMLLMDALHLNKRGDFPSNFLEWETILIIVPSRQISHELKQYRFSISRIAFATNINAKQIHIFDYKDWKNAFKNKTQLQIRNLLKTTFGGVKSISEDHKS